MESQRILWHMVVNNKEVCTSFVAYRLQAYSLRCEGSLQALDMSLKTDRACSSPSDHLGTEGTRGMSLFTLITISLTTVVRYYLVRTWPSGPWFDLEPSMSRIYYPYLVLKCGLTINIQYFYSIMACV